MLFKSTIIATLAASVLASPLHQHHEHQERREVVTVTVNAANAAGSATTLATSTISSSSSSASASGSSGSSDVTVGSGGALGVTYSPYSDDGGCKSSSQIASEVAQLSGFNIIRLYGVDCDQVGAVMAAKTSSQKIFAGIFDVANIESSVSTLAEAVKANGGWGEIHTVSVGNELVNAGSATPSQIKGYVETARTALTAAGYTGDVVSVDTFIAVMNNPSLCEYSDYIAVNGHAFFDGNYAAENAGEWVLGQIQGVAATCGGDKKVLITETGWPSRGDSNGKAVPSKANQKAAISSIKSTCGDDVILFTAFNDLWKADGPYNAEKYWGFLSS